jgi:hypothetical protein
VRAAQHALTSLDFNRALDYNQLTEVSVGLFDGLTNLQEL